MKKIVKNEPEVQPQPALVRSAHSVLDLNPEPKIPPSVLYNSNLKTMKGFKNLRNNMKREAFLKEFVKSGIEALEPYQVDEDTRYDSEIVKFMCQSVEDIFVKYNKQGDEKKKAVVEICKKYFDDNEVLVSKVIEQVLPFIHRSTFWRRNKHRFYDMIVLFLGMFKGK